MKARGTGALWSIRFGYGSMLLGALDPLEGSLLILMGSGLVLFGTLISANQRPWLGSRAGVFALVALGIGVMWVLSTFGGIGGDAGVSVGWGILIVPYAVGWLWGICGAGAPRWVLRVGVVVGVWYLVLSGLLLNERESGINVVSAVTALFGIVTLVGCVYQLRSNCGRPCKQ